MASNHKLTSLIQGRRITSTQDGGDDKKIVFDDGSVMTVRLAPSGSASAATGGTVKSVRQHDTEIDLDMADGSTLTFALAEEASCVMVRGKDGGLEYAD